MKPVAEASSRAFFEMRDSNQWQCTRAVEHGWEFTKHGRDFSGIYDLGLGRAYVLYIED